MACACKNKVVTNTTKQVVKRVAATRNAPNTKRTTIKRVIGRRHPLA